MSAQHGTHTIDPGASAAQVKRIWKAFWILLILTIIELALGLLIFQLDKGDPSYGLILFIKGVIVILTFFKAFYIISIFMHLGDEKRQLILTMGIPATLFIWFITAFLVDGNSFRVMRNTNAHSKKYIEQPVHKKAAPAATTPATSPDKKLD